MTLNSLLCGKHYEWSLSLRCLNHCYYKKTQIIAALNVTVCSAFAVGTHLHIAQPEARTERWTSGRCGRTEWRGFLCKRAHLWEQKKKHFFCLFFFTCSWILMDRKLSWDFPSSYFRFVIPKAIIDWKIISHHLTWPVVTSALIIHSVWVNAL